jgi:hypothetical protein
MSKKQTGPKGPTANDLALLGAAVDAYNTNKPLMVMKQSMQLWVTMRGGPYVEFNDSIQQPSPSGHGPPLVACRATAAGIAYSTANGRPSGASVASSNLQTNGPSPVAQALTDSQVETSYTFVLEDDVPIPTIHRGRKGGGESKKYPFAIMTVGQSFFIPQTDENPKPAKRIAAVVSTATKEFSPKRFKVVTVSEPQGEGCRIWRVADWTPEEIAAAHAARAAAQTQVS